MSLRTIIDQSLVIVQSVPNTGKTYKHSVWSVDDAEVVSLFVDGNSRINTIVITRESTQSIDRGPNDNRDRHTLVLRWYRSAKVLTADASSTTEDTFQDDVEALRTAFKNNRKLTDANGVHHSVRLCDPMEARLVGFVTFKGVTCNYAELVFVAEDGPFKTTSV